MGCALTVVLGIVVEWWPLALVGAGLALLAWTLGRQRGGKTGAASVTRPSGREAYDTLARDAEELAQRLAAELDAKADRIERLLAQADDRLRRLEGGSVLGGEPKPRRAPAVTPSDGARDPLNRQVYALADEGLAPVAIAQRLDQPTGKVELILALRGR